MVRPFKYVAGQTVSQAASTTSAAKALEGEPRQGEFQVRLVNAGAATVFVDFGDSSVAAATTDLPLPAGAIEVLTVPEGTTHVAVITASGSATLYATVGDGN